MKYSLHYHKNLIEPYEIKAKNADEAIKIHEEYPNAYILLLNNNDLTKDTIILCQNKLRLLVKNYQDYIKASELKLPYILMDYINNGFDLDNISKEKLCIGIRISYPLFFNKDLLKNYTNLEKRFVANNIYNGIYPTRDKLYRSCWLRPEDIQLYEDFIDVIEWENDIKESKELALFRIYNQGYWNGDMGMLFDPPIDNFVINSAIKDDIAKARINCKQKCMEGKSCNICYYAFNIPKKIKERELKNDK